LSALPAARSGPALDPRFLFSYIGEETWNELSTKHLRVYQVHTGSEKKQQLSTMDLYLDPASLLPLGIAFKTHPDKDMNTDIPTEIHFVDYTLVDGVEVPMHIQRLENGGLLMDVKVTAASINTVLSDDNFDAH
jgi:hypothetical protein